MKKSQNCRFYKYKNHYVQNKPFFIPWNIDEEYEIT